MEFTLAARKDTIKEQFKKFTTYQDCPLCDGYFHSTKACLFRKHAKYINILHKKIQSAAAMPNSDTATITGKLILLGGNEEDSSDEEEVEPPEDEDDDDQSYMVIIHNPTDADEDDYSSDEGEYEVEDELPLTAFDKILEAVVSLPNKKKETSKKEYEGQWREPGEGNEDNRPDTIQPDSGYGTLPPTLQDARKLLVFGEDPEDTPCELNLQNF